MSIQKTQKKKRGDGLQCVYGDVSDLQKRLCSCLGFPNQKYAVCQV